MRLDVGVGHSPQTRLFAPAATFARVRLRNFCIRKRPSFLASRRFAQGIPDTIVLMNYLDSITSKRMQWAIVRVPPLRNGRPSSLRTSEDCIQSSESAEKFSNIISCLFW